MEELIRNLPALLVILTVLTVSVWVLSSVISVAQTAKLLLTEQRKTNAILTAVHGLDGANARCTACSARITVDAARMGHAARCPACGKVVRADALTKPA